MSAPKYDNSTLLREPNQSPSLKHHMLHNGNGRHEQSLSSLDSSACGLFFGISELIEMSLMHVPTLQLLVIQRVNTRFQDIITTSGPLQKKLFFKPDYSKGNGRYVEWDPFTHKLETEWEHDRLQQSLWNGCGKLRMTDLTNVYPNASWKRMFVCQPPKTKIEMVRFNHNSSCYLGFLAVVEVKEHWGGCRMSHVYEYGWQDDVTLSDDCYIRLDC